MTLPGQNTPQVQEKLRIHFAKADKQIESLRRKLEKRAKTRDAVYLQWLAMISTLYTQVDSGQDKEMIKEELNMFGFLIKKAIEYNRDIENDEQEKLL
jgi:hypothetical protein